MLCLLISVNLFSQGVLVIEQNSRTYTTENKLEYQWDTKGYSIEDIRTPSVQKNFAASSRINFGITHRGLWLKLKVQNLHPEQEQAFVFEVDYPHLDTLKFYSCGADGKWNETITGDKTAFDSRPIENKSFAFPIELRDTAVKEYYFYIGGDGSRQFPLFVQSKEKFYKSQAKVDIIHGGAFFGILLVMLFYNLFIYLALKERAYLYYVLMNICVFVVYMGYSGYGYQYVWRNHVWMNAGIIPLSILLHGFTGTLFTRNFLDTKVYVHILHRVLTGILYTYGVILVVFSFLPYEFTLKIAVFMAFFNSFVVLITSYRVWLKGNKYAQFMALSFSFYLVGILLLSSNILGFLPRNFVVAHSMEIGTAIEITMLSFALGYKYSHYRREKEEAQSKLLEVQKKINIELEHNVAERTHEINRQKGELQELNKVKDKLLSVISHDLKGPVNAMQSLVSMMKDDKPSKENLKMYSLHLNNKINAMSGLLENMLQWIRSQKEGLNFKIENLSLKEIVETNISVASSQAELKGIFISNQIPEGICLQGDKNVVHLVIRNLLGNAIKFTESGGKVFVSAMTEGEEVIVEVRDTGVGIAKDKINMLFNDDTHYSTPDTNAKEGTGLGLLLCKEFLAKTNGRIWVESEKGNGASFKFSLPTAK